MGGNYDLGKSLKSGSGFLGGIDGGKYAPEMAALGMAMMGAPALLGAGAAGAAGAAGGAGFGSLAGADAAAAGMGGGTASLFGPTTAMSNMLATGAPASIPSLGDIAATGGAAGGDLTTGLGSLGANAVPGQSASMFSTLQGKFANAAPQMGRIGMNMMQQGMQPNPSQNIGAQMAMQRPPGMNQQQPAQSPPFAMNQPAAPGMGQTAPIHGGTGLQDILRRLQGGGMYG